MRLVMETVPKMMYESTKGTEDSVYIISDRLIMNAEKGWWTPQEEYHIGPEEDKAWNRRYGLAQLGTASLIVTILHSLFGASLYGLFIALTLNFAIVHNIVDYFHTKAEERAIAAEKAATPFPYFLEEKEIVGEIITFAKKHEKWPITNIGYVSQFHITHNSNPHHMTTLSHQQGVLKRRKRSLDQAKKSGNIDLVENLEKDISEWNSKIICSKEQRVRYLSIYTKTRVNAEKKLNSLFGEILELQKKEIIQHSRELSNASSILGKKNVSLKQVREYVDKLSTPLIVPDAKNVLYARANLVMKGLRE